MSKESWLEEFWLGDIENLDRDNEIEIINHSLQKWIGLLPENLDKHGAFINNFRNVSTDKELILITGNTTCSLCRFYDCDNTCPIFRSKMGCDDIPNSPWRKYMNESDPKPMVRLLKRIMKKAIKEKQNNA